MPVKYTRELLAEAAAQSTSIASMLRYMGVEPYDSAYSYLKKRLAEFDIDTAHFRFRPGPAPDFATQTIDPAPLQEAVASQVSLVGVVRILGLPETNAARRLIQAEISRHRIDTKHFTGQAHNRGKRSPSRFAPEQVLVQRPPHAPRLPGRRIRRALAELGRPELCEGCGIGPEWQSHPLTLEVDHISGDWSDNRPDNLRLLCPNCHSVTDTYCRKNSLQP